MAYPPRPRFHFTPPSGWMNDPNGLVFHDGEYHLFYQYHPHSLVWGPMHWGHAVSRDLVTWEHLPVALVPDPLGTIFSGSAVWDGDDTSRLVPGGGFVALFSYDTQAQGLAFSTDRGRTWTKYSGNPVLPALAKDFRDPKVFSHGTGWCLVLAAGDHLEFYRSADLIAWEPTGRFDAVLEAGVWECPDLFPLAGPDGDRWVLVLSVTDHAPNGGSGTLYWVGDFDGLTFAARSGPSWLDWGPDNYAGVTFNGLVSDNRVLIGWMNNWRYGRDIPADRWRGAMTVPRRLTLVGPGPWLAQEPLVSPRAPAVHRETSRLRGTLTLGPVPAASDLHLVLEAEGPVEWRLIRNEARVTLTWDPRQGTIVLDRSASGRVDFHPDFARPLTLVLKKPGPRLDLRVLLDEFSLELFAESGLSVMTALVFPPEGRFWEVEVEAESATLGGWSVTTVASPGAGTRT